MFLCPRGPSAETASPSAQCGTYDSDFSRLWPRGRVLSPHPANCCVAACLTSAVCSPPDHPPPRSERLAQWWCCDLSQRQHGTAASATAAVVDTTSTKTASKSITTPENSVRKYPAQVQASNHAHYERVRGVTMVKRRHRCAPLDIGL